LGDAYWDGVPEERWRGNQYIRANGILPYGLCGSGSDEREPGVELTAVTGGKGWAFTTLAANAWGESDEKGKPVRGDHIQVLMYYQKKGGRPCHKMDRNPYMHCVMPLKEFDFECRIGLGEWQQAWRRPDRSLKDQTVAQDILHCNLTNGVAELRDKFGVEFRVRDPADGSLVGKSTIKLDVCYMHVKKTWPLAICTEPMYGLKRDSKFWFNHPWQRNNTFSVLDEFVTYHIMQGVKVQVHDHDGSLNISMSRYRNNPAVAYRRGWSLPAITFPAVLANSKATAYESHAETACMWEHRFRAKWIQILHSADNFAFPLKPGVLISDLARNLDPRHIHNVNVPACTPSSNPAPPRPATSLIEKFSLMPHLLMCLYGKERSTPFGDPRAFDSTNVHWFTAPRPGFNISKSMKTFGTKWAIKEMGYFTMHIMGLGRTQLDQHIGPTNFKWSFLHRMLQKNLDKLEALPP